MALKAPNGLDLPIQQNPDIAWTDSATSSLEEMTGPATCKKDRQTDADERELRRPSPRTEA